MPTISTNNGTVGQEEDMEQFENEGKKSSDEETASGSGGEGDDPEDEDEGSSDMDEEECDKRKTECIDDMAELSNQFCKLKDQLFSEREAQIESRLKDLRNGSDPDYKNRLKQLEINTNERHRVAEVRFELGNAIIEEKYSSEQLALQQNIESTMELLRDQLETDLEEKIKHLEEDRHTIDLTSDLFESQNEKKARRHERDSSDRRKKPVLVSRPFIVYEIEEADILDDWKMIKRSIKQHAQKRKSDHL